jgi:hypothetical protein
MPQRLANGDMNGIGLGAVTYGFWGLEAHQSSPCPGRGKKESYQK